MADLSTSLFFLTFAFLPFGQLTKLPLKIEGASVYLHDLFLAGLWFWLIITKSGKLVKQKLFKRMLLFVIIAGFSWLINFFHFGNNSLLNIGYLLRLVLFFSVYFAVLFLDQNKIEILKLIKRSIFWLAIAGWIQYLFFPDLTKLKYFNWDDHYFRMTGSLLDPNFFGLMLVLGFGLELWQGKSFLKKAFYLVSLGLTFSRGSWLAFLLMVLFWGVNQLFGQLEFKNFKQRLKQNFKKSFNVSAAFFWICLSLIVFFLIPKPAGEGGNLTRTVSVASRYHSWIKAVEIFRQKPILGVGFNNYRLAQKEKGFLDSDNWRTNHAGAGADNSYLFVLATCGILGLIAFGYFLSALSPWWLMMPVAVHSLFNNSWFYPWVIIFVLAIAGLAKLPKEDKI